MHAVLVARHRLSVGADHVGSDAVNRALRQSRAANRWGAIPSIPESPSSSILEYKTNDFLESECRRVAWRRLERSSSREEVGSSGDIWWPTFSGQDIRTFAWS